VRETGGQCRLDAVAKLPVDAAAHCADSAAMSRVDVTRVRSATVRTDSVRRRAKKLAKNLQMLALEGGSVTRLKKTVERPPMDISRSCS
jgi:hypothetical protein